MDRNWIKAIGFGGMLLGFAATVIANWTQEKQTEQMIEEKVQEALDAREEESE